MFQKFGAEIAKDPSDIALKCQRLITMLPNSSHVMEVFTADNGILRFHSF